MTDPRSLALPDREQSTELAKQWRVLTRAATFVAILTSPAVFVWLHKHHGWSIGWSIVGAVGLIAAFRGFLDLILRRFLPWPSLFGTEDARLRDEDVVNRRRASFWGFAWRLVRLFLIAVLIVWLYRSLVYGWSDPIHVAKATFHWIAHVPSRLRAYAPFLAILPFYFIFNFVILMGPLLLMGISQIRGFEPGDADWGVKLDDVRGQKEAKEEVRRIVSLWQSGEHFEQAGGKRERGLLFLGAPGTGKTMLAKAIATGFNCFAPNERFLTEDGVKTFAETAGTVRSVLTREGKWARAEIRSFGRQRLVEVELRPGGQTRSSGGLRRVIRATPDHRWLTTTRGTVTDLRAGDVVPFQAPPASRRNDEAFIRGFGYGAGTLDSRGRARVRLRGEKNRRHLPLFEEFGRSFVSYLPSYDGDALVVFTGAAMSNWKELPRGTESPEWLAGWVEGYLAADGSSDAAGAVVLQTQDAEAAAFVERVAVHAGYMVVGKHVQAASLVTNYGARSAPLTSLELRREGVWQVLDVRPLPIESEVYCAVEPTTGTFTLADGVLTGNCPFISIPGSGFAQTFIGIDAIIVRWLARKAKKMAAKWGGQCIVFIDEIDAVGMRRSALAGASMQPTSIEDFLFFGPNGALNPSGDMILETRAWREKLFQHRAPEPQSPYPRWAQRLGAIVNQAAFPGAMGGMGQLALNQLLITMDGVDNPPFMKRTLTNWTNKILDALYIVPTRVRGHSLRLPKPKPRRDQIYFIGATNVPIDALDPALTRPGRMGRHVWFRTPTKQDRLDIFDLYLAKVAHHEELDRPQRRDEIARITSGYSPAMIDQVCSLALTYAHHRGYAAFEWEDMVEAMTTLESGTAIGIDYVPVETRATAIHEAGHAVAGHVYMKGRESTRVSIRMRGGSLGHHQALEKEERFSRFRSEEIGLIIWGLGAMAAERVFYGENTNGVGGDLQSVTAAAAWMVGASGMGPERVELNGHARRNGQPRKRLPAEVQRAEIMRRFEEIGIQIMNRASNGDIAHNAIGAVLSDRDKRRMVAQILGQAYMKAYHLMLFNKDKVETIANVVIQKKEIYGDELVRLLNGADLQIPDVDLTDEKAWPVL